VRWPSVARRHGRRDSAEPGAPRDRQPDVRLLSAPVLVAPHGNVPGSVRRPDAVRQPGKPRRGGLPPQGSRRAVEPLRWSFPSRSSKGAESGYRFHACRCHACRRCPGSPSRNCPDCRTCRRLPCACHDYLSPLATTVSVRCCGTAGLRPSPCWGSWSGQWRPSWPPEATYSTGGSKPSRNRRRRPAGRRQRRVGRRLVEDDSGPPQADGLRHVGEIWLTVSRSFCS